ncbi:MAG: Protein YceG like [Parcubacteria group bacterium]|nr:Protein YceG like [Parcubacteria group bacterium]
MPHSPGKKPPRVAKPPSKKRGSSAFPIASCTLILVLGFFALPSLLAIDLSLSEQIHPPQAKFTITVDPANKTITTDPQVEAMLNTKPTTLTAAASEAGNIFTWIAVAIANSPAYRQLAGANTLFVTIKPGFRDEQVAAAIGGTLNWKPAQIAEFLKKSRAEDTKLPNGQFVPGTYFLSVTDPDQVVTMLDQRFQEDILSRYSSTTQEQVPVPDALTVASLIERESGGWDDARMISGIIWNRIFAGMPLQIDATLQYAKANATTGKQGIWWPQVLPKDKYIKSAYNTYMHAGLPPGPIANPSIAAVVAALNPKKTDCLFYFHDSHGNFHCSKDYATHVKLLKQYYGQGK